MADAVIFSGLESQLSYGSKCADSFREVLYVLGKTMLKQTKINDNFDEIGNIIAKEGLDHAHVLANKLHSERSATP